jgi:hypothetical protein
MTRRAVAAAFACGLILVVMSGCTGPHTRGRLVTPSATTPSDPTPVSADADASTASSRPALTILTSPALYQLPVTPEQVVSDGAVIVTNPLDRPVTLESIEPLFLPGTRTDDVEILGTRLIQLTTDVADTGLGIQRVYPPALLPGERFVDVDGLVLAPATSPAQRYVVSVGFRVSHGMAIITGLEVRFRVDGRQYAQVIEHELRICEGRPAGATDCPAPPHL